MEAVVRRGVFHICFGMLIALSGLFLSRSTVLITLGILVLLELALELARFAVPYVNRWFFRIFNPFVREAEATSATGALYMLIASFLAYLAGEFANSFVLAKMKIATEGRWLWLRTIGSTLVGQGLDSLMFITLAFAGTIPLKVLISAIVTQWLIKSIYEAALTPLTYTVVGFLKRKEGMDVYDHDTRFNPLLISE